METRVLTEADFEEGAELARSVGWKDSVDDWRVISSCATCLGLRENGRLIATVALCDFGGVVSVAKMLVHAECRGRGLAKRLLAEALALRKRADAVQMLIATAEGYPVYERAGFKSVEKIHFINGTASGLRESKAVELGTEALPLAVALDARSVGCERGPMIAARWQRAVARFGVMRGGELVAFGLRLKQGPGSLVGPLVARELGDAVEVLHALLPRDGSFVRVDVPERQTAFRAEVLRLGLNEGTPRTEMTLGGAALPGERAMRFCPAALAYG
ncbi:MAG: GNAT family N-acetyltransferase [Myxococcaceae bacterium]